MPSYIVQKPILKWAGGKHKLLHHLLPRFPKQMHNYHDIFVGGGSVLFAILSLRNQGDIVIDGGVYASDINTDLINFYKILQTRPDILYEHVSKHFDLYDTLPTALKGEANRKPLNMGEALSSKESYYYWLRTEYNINNILDDVEKASLFLVLNKLCFRGLYREGPNGFNVPFGHYKVSPKLERDELCNIGLLIKDVMFSVADYNTSMEKPVTGDFVYLDPPYAPETKNSFVGYTKSGFGLEQHIELFEKIKGLDKFVMSNSCVSLVTEAFATDEFHIHKIVARRAINSKNPEATTQEVIINNIKE